MLTQKKEALLNFFKSQKKQLLYDWDKSIIVSDEDPFRDKILANGESLFNLVLMVFKMTQEELLEYIEYLATSVSLERAEANINIGEFVYNVNLGRSVLYSYLSKAELDWSDMQEAINLINFCFDKFLYFAVSHYTEEKNKIIEEKTKYIDSTHQDRLTLLGQMTSSFIHEFRNPLTSIQGFIQLLKSDFPDMKYLDIISNELGQLNFRISQFLLLSKKELIGKEKSYFSLNTLIEEVLNFLYPSILDGKVKIDKKLAGDPQLYGYADEIRQVFINIIFNAIDVLGHQGSENPLIGIVSESFDETSVKITVSNNGPMIPEEIQKTIFEPFFTTKKLGTGLGLFVCKEIIEKHKGELYCKSLPKNTAFSIILPIALDT
ncbi:histidine kinase N-terminal domain-containing protein [Neobacillus terrae]|uniref:histidine kinase N-terminal domain-containing protein n=1 Tax=Neobacillus terrae TaxID=3034837 RepID=UPI00140BB28D|nr:histidine kinase N-terminal domain-containing protein [Neobacillus terrae]NHM31796.1 GHKL domain-containing protein [Neobacillus terrae]